MSLQTRKPTGKVAFPIIMLAGIEGSGKTWAAVEASGMEWVDRAFFLEIGESMADEYGTVPGADFEIIEHDGTFRRILACAQLAAEIQPAEGKANLLIVDSMTEVWGLLTDMAQGEANGRKKNRRADTEAQITMDLWNRAKGRLEDFMDALRAFPGPVILTCRLDNVAEVEGGKPTGQMIWKPRTEKNIPYQVQAIVQARAPREWYLTKVASTRLQLEPGGYRHLKDFTVAGLLDLMDVKPSAAPSTYVRPSDGAVTDGELLNRIRRFEAEADAEKLQKMQRWCFEHGRDEALSETVQAIGRLNNRMAQEAQQTVQDELGGEVVEGEIVGA